jgi:hypothetical protein
MTPSFQLVGIDHKPFEPLFLLSDEALKKHRAERHIATQSPGYPCRVSLEDAKVGEELLLLPYLHQPAASPYRASGPIFVRRAAKQRRLEVGEVTSYVTSRLMSLRAYDKADMIVAASVCEGVLVAKEIESYFSNDQVDYIHLHNAGRGCFSCQVIRA